LKFINLTRRTEIGANSYYLEIGGHPIILDCGMHPKSAGEDALPGFKPIADRQIEAILISHAHQDHIGTLPVLMRRQQYRCVTGRQKSGRRHTCTSVPRLRTCPGC